MMNYQGNDRDRDRDSTMRKGMRRRGCVFCGSNAPGIDYKDPQSLKYFVSDRGKVVPRRISGNCAKHQRELNVAIKRARCIALLPFTAND